MSDLQLYTIHQYPEMSPPEDSIITAFKALCWEEDWRASTTELFLDVDLNNNAKNKTIA